MRSSLRSLSTAVVLALSAVSVVTGCASDPNDRDERVTAAPTAIDLGTANAETELTFEVPEEILGFSIIVDGAAGEQDFLGVKELRAPNGDVVIRDFAPTKIEGRSQTGNNGTGIGVVRVPFVGDQATEKVPAGTWTVRLGGLRGNPKLGKGASGPWSGRLHGAVRLQTGAAGAFKGGELDLDVYVPSGLAVGDGKNGSTISGATAAENAYLVERIDLAYGMMQRLWGLDRGEVRFHAVDASLASIVGQDAIDAANQAATHRTERPAAQLVLTNLLAPDGKGGGEISGVSNCLPGAVGVPGTACSAVIVSLRQDSEAWVDAATIVHELGHFIGLEHTTELGGRSDSLADTPACANTDEKSALTRCPDVDNIMFPTANLATAPASLWSSDLQRALVRTSPIYRARR